jgi:hypothetical protein
MRRSGGSLAAVVLVLTLGFLAWWCWPSIEPALALLDRSAPIEVAGLRVKPAVGVAAVSTSEPIMARAAELTLPGPTAAPYCGPGQRPDFVLGFAALKQQLGPTMGEPVECEHADAVSGDSLQRTTTGLAVYDKRANLAMFTDGWRRWALTQHGLVGWEGDDVPAEVLAGR